MMESPVKGTNNANNARLGIVYMNPVIHVTGPYAEELLTMRMLIMNEIKNPITTAITVSWICSRSRCPMTGKLRANQSQRMSGSPGVIDQLPSPSHFSTRAADYMLPLDKRGAY